MQALIIGAVIVVTGVGTIGMTQLNMTAEDWQKLEGKPVTKRMVKIARGAAYILMFGMALWLLSQCMSGGGSFCDYGGHGAADCDY